MGLFTASPTGSVMGNILRGIARAATGGILGNGAMLQARNEREGVTGGTQAAAGGLNLNGVLQGVQSNLNAVDQNKQSAQDLAAIKQYAIYAGLALAAFFVFSQFKK